jgi:phosphoribosylamine---glycine ligase
MKILVIDANGLALDFCLRSMAEGHEVVWFIRDHKPGIRTIGQGLVPKTGDWASRMKWADLIFLPDNACYMRDMQWYHEHGYPIYGANDWTARWELERGTGMDVLEKHGVKTLGGECFTNYDKAIEYVRSTMGRYVSKPSGDADKALSYVSKNPADMIFMLERWKKLGKLKAPFILQKFTKGCEMAVGAWVGKEGFASPWCENFEFKKLMPDDLGVATGEQGTVIRYTESSKLADKVLKPVEAYLVECGHMGFVDVNCIIDDKGNPWPLEFTMRPGWPIFNIQQQLHRSTASWMKSSLEGRSIRSNFLTDKIATGIVVSIPDYPYSSKPRAESSGIPIYGLEATENSIHLCECKAGSAPALNGKTVKTEPMIVTAGNYVLVTCGTGKTVQESREGAYEVAESLIIPNSPAWRTDVGERLKSQLPQMQKMGYAKGMTF